MMGCSPSPHPAELILLYMHPANQCTCRYSKMANAIIGDQDYIYSGDYRGEMTSIFGGDMADI